MTTVSTELLVDAICGAGFGGSMTTAVTAEQQGLAKFTGNQHNPDWEWRRDALSALALNVLEELYAAIAACRKAHHHAS